MIICTPACLDPELAVAFTQPYSKICVALSIVRPNTQTYWSSWSAETKPRQLWHSQCPGCLGHTAKENAKCNQCSPACLQNIPAAGTCCSGGQQPALPHTSTTLFPAHQLENNFFHQTGWMVGTTGRLEGSMRAQVGFRQWNVAGIKQVHSLMNYSKVINSLRETFATV